MELGGFGHLGHHGALCGVGVVCDMVCPLETCPSSLPNMLRHRQHRTEHGDCPHHTQLTLTS